jgi:hypothetical protein
MEDFIFSIIGWFWVAGVAAWIILMVFLIKKWLKGDL